MQLTNKWQSLLILIVSSLLLNIAVANDSASAQPKTDRPAQESWLFVLSAEIGDIRQNDQGDQGKHYQLSLKDIDTHVVAFTDRPERKTTLIPSMEFIQNFNKMFASSKPNAVLVHSGLTRTHQPVAVTIQAINIAKEGSASMLITPLPNTTDIPNGELKEVRLFIDNALGDLGSTMPAEMPEGK